MKCPRELSCDPGSFYLSTYVRRSWLLAGVEGTKYVCRQGLLRMDLLLTVVGVKKKESSDGALFIVDTT